MTSNEPTGTGQGVLPIAVRLAQPSDTRAVLDFTRATWDGWDYLPLVWDDWLQSSDGVLLVALAQEPRRGEIPQLDLFGRPFGPDRPIAVARVAMLAPTQAWLEGLRVDPGVRNRGVAGLLHAAGLLWARAQGATGVRYATGEANVASHRLGERHGFRLLRPWRSFHLPPDAAPDADDAGIGGADDDQPWDLDDDAGMVPVDVAARAVEPADDDRASEAVRESPDADDEEGERLAEGAAAAPRAAAALRAASADPIARLRRAALGLPRDSDEDTVARWWGRIDRDSSFALGDRLYEPRGWAFAELTRERFAAHIAAGEVIVRESDGAWAAGVVPAADPRFEGDRPWVALLVGDALTALELVIAARQALRQPIRLRVPDGAPVVAGHEDAFGAAGFHGSRETLHVFARTLPPEAVIDAGPAGMLELVDRPRRLVRAPDPSRRRRHPIG